MYDHATNSVYMVTMRPYVILSNLPFFPNLSASGSPMEILPKSQTPPNTKAAGASQRKLNNKPNLTLKNHYKWQR